MFSDRIEITNPGKPLVQPERFIDYPPRSRNEALAALMRRMRLCEELGTGIESHNAAQVSGVIKNAINASLIKAADSSAPRSGYIPIWA